MGNIAQSTQLQILPRGQFTPLENITLQGLAASAVNIILIIASLLFVFNLLFGGIKVILSGGDKEKLDIAKRQLVNSFLGIAIVFSSWAILGFVSQFFGIDLLTFDIPTL
ncbi:hypothetical protein A3A75_03750 [Candidatus Woesebacteria bacterium RIFCSPLOWO2_01_FULL_39_10]|uniref:Uncharacterized protein n=1 Tax=Candidatus Woesebacteria bacterium RIFCSPLOWO2_01_FULL_39_10 TaxID=1802516 RepID=A0A1F8B899_9BACT|nr:MAG: hypothetical protein A3A75_03750 [Candidatus Woesebacteria bacterium RIFCSPLOWO2_01_FULL_39_10]